MDRHLAGELSPTEEQEFHEMLSSSEEALESFCEQGMLDGRLRWEHGTTSRRPKPVPRMTWLVGVVSAALVLGLIVSQLINKDSKIATGGDELTDPFVATLALTGDCEWAGPAQIPEGGAMLPGLYELVTGKANIVMDCGASVLVEAPAQFHLIGTNRMLLTGGKLAARMAENATVPFIVDTPDTTAIDRGTEFTVAVDEHQQTEILIQDGAVEVHEQKGEDRTVHQLTVDSGFRTSDQGPGETFQEFSPSRFKERYNWSETGKGYWHWSFDEAEGIELIEDGKGISSLRYNGELRSKRAGRQLPNRQTGVFGGALSFHGSKGNSLVRTNCPGIAGARSRTVAFWVRIPRDAKDVDAHSIVSWGSREVSGARWHLGWNPSSQPGVTGAICTEANGGYVVGSTDLRDGEWHHVVSVFSGGLGADVATGIQHYIDGKLEATSASRKQFVATAVWAGAAGRHVPELPVRFGMRAADFSRPSQFFRGDLDEVYIFNSALSIAEIGDLMKNRRPQIENQSIN